MAWVMVGFGIPNEIYSDNGLEFKNQLQAAMSRCFGYSQKFTIPHSPWTNRAERTHATLGSVLRILMSQSKRGPDTWDEVIPLVAGLINQRVCAATGVAPNDLIFTFWPCHPVDLIAKNADESKGGTLPEFLREVRNGYEIMAEHAGGEQDKQYIRLKRQYKKGEEWKAGDHCMFLSSQAEIGISKKITPTWTGPHVIDRVINTQQVVLEELDTGRRFTPTSRG